MSGNIGEWCSDWYDDKYYNHSKKENPAGPTSGIYKVCRGGCSLNSSYEMRVCSRMRRLPHMRDYIGIRLASSMS